MSDARKKIDELNLLYEEPMAARLDNKTLRVLFCPGILLFGIRLDKKFDS